MIEPFLQDPSIVLSAALRALSLGLALLAAGTILINALWLDEDGMLASRSPRTAISASLVAIVAAIASWVDTVNQLYGDTSSAFDLTIIESSLSTPPGQALALMLAGLAWIIFTTIGARTLPNLALVGAVAVVMSIGIVGHTNSEPRWMLYGLLTAHLFIASLWLGVLRPLAKLTQQPRYRGHAADLAEDFGKWALLLMPALFGLGGYLGWQLMGQPTELPSHPFARLMQLKVALVALLLVIGAVNRFSIVPRLHDDPRACTQLRWAVSAEGVVFALIFFTVCATTLQYHPLPH